ncbi:MAG TPA: hypothetical protein VIB62_08100 [Actinomycetota bacterium]|jgi:hypothetical protein
MTGPDAAGLYREPPEGFTVARDALVRRLKDAGEDAAAAAVKKLRRPTVAAWTLNRLSAEDPEAVAELLASGDALSAAQRSVMGGGSPAELHDATARRRALVADLTKRAAAILRDGGRSPDAYMEDLQGMLEAASVEPEAGERLRTGTIEKTVRPSSGFGPGLSIVDAGATAEGSGDVPMAGATKAERAQALDADIASLGATMKQQERIAASAERARDEASAAVDAARERLDTAKASLNEADAELSTAKLALRRTRRALENARTARAKLP